MRNIPRLFTAWLILLLVFLPGCFSFQNPFSGMFARDKTKDQLKEIHVTSKPVKTPEHLEGERVALAMGLNRVADARDISTEAEVVTELAKAQRVLLALRRSLGTPTSEVSSKLKDMMEVISNLDEHNVDLSRKLNEYDSEMRDLKNKIIKLKASYGAATQENDSLTASIARWTMYAVILSVLFAVCVPGGMVIVKRFWTKAGGLAVFAGQKAIESCKGLSLQLSRYAETLNDVEREKFKKVMKDMEPTDVSFWDKVRSGRDPLEEFLEKDSTVQNSKLDLLYKRARQLRG